MTFPFSASIPVERYEAAARKTDAAFAAIVAEAPWVLDVPQKAKALAEENASRRSKFKRFLILADQVNNAVAPHVACASGCSACCRIGVSLTTYEAQVLGDSIGVQPAIPSKTISIEEGLDLEAETNRYFGTPCPFLSENLCSIYEHRPLACRTHVNLGDAFFCDTSVPPEESYVTHLDMRAFFLCLTFLLLDSPAADIRDFFPNGLQKVNSGV